MSNDPVTQTNVSFGTNNNLQNATVNIDEAIGRDKIIYTAHDWNDVRELSVHNPYRGLHSFTYAERADYAGREDLAQAALATVALAQAERRLLFITGASGSGKSSFAQAGLVPALEQHYAQRGLRVRYAVFHPGGLPLAMFGDALEQIQIDLPPETPLTRATFVPLLKQHAQPNDCFVFVVDQFEECFTLADPAGRDELLAILATLPPFDELPLHILITLRSDYIVELANFPQLYASVRQGIVLGTLAPEQLKLSIQRPLANLLQRLELPPGAKRFEEALLDQLASDTTSDATYLPLLQVTLQDLWAQGWLERGRYLSLTSALSRWAEDLYAWTDYATARSVPRSASEQARLMAIFLDLVDVSLDDDSDRDVLRRRPLQEFVCSDPEPLRLIRAGIEARLLSVSSEASPHGELIVVDIIHASLLQNWPRLHQAIAVERSRLQRRARFEVALAEWEANQRGDAYLLSDVRLAEARELASKGDIAVRSEPAQILLQHSIVLHEAKHERDLDESRALAAALEQGRQRTRKFVIGLVLVLIVALGAAVWATRAESRARTQLTVTESQRLAAAAQSQAANSPQIGLLLAIEAVLQDRNALTSQALRDAVNQATWIPSPLQGHTDMIHTFEVSRDGTRILTASADGTARTWDSEGTPLHVFAVHTGVVNSAVFNRDGTRILTTSADKTIRLWRDDGLLLDTFDLGFENTAATTAFFSPDDARILAVVQDGSLRLYNLERDAIVDTGEWHFMPPTLLDIPPSPVFSPDSQSVLMLASDKSVLLWHLDGSPDTFFAEHDNLIRSIEFTPDGEYVLTASDDTTARIWTLDGTLDRTLDDHTETVVRFVASPNPEAPYLLTASWDGTARVWTPDGEQRAILRGHTSALNSIRASADSARFLTTSDDGTVRVWRDDGQLEATLANNDTNPLTDAMFVDGSGRILTMTADRKLLLWHPIEQSLVLAEHSNDLGRALWLPDGQRILTVSWDHTARIWDATGTQSQVLDGHADEITYAAWNADGSLLLTASKDSLTNLWSGAGELLQTLFGHTGQVYMASFSPDGQSILTASADGTARLWDLESNPLATLIGHRNIVWSATFSPDGQHILTASEDTTARIWDTHGNLQQTLRGHTGSVVMASYSPDGQYILTASTDTTARLWKSSGELVAVLSGHLERITSAEFDSASQQIVTSSRDGTARVWNLKGQTTATLTGHTDDVLYATFNAAGTQILTASEDNTARLWRSSGELLTTFTGHNDWVNWAAFSPDEQRIVTASADNTARIHFVQLDDVLALAVCRVGRDLSAEEIARFQVGPTRFRLARRQCPPRFSWQK